MLTMSIPRAMLYGMPHIGCEYLGSTARRYRLTQDFCAVCGGRATNCHHIVPIGRGEYLEAPDGQRLRSPLIALCGTGTTGCHGKFHAGLIKARWVWEEGCEELWRSGVLLMELEPHDRLLYAYGWWEIETPDGTTVIRERV